MSDNTGFQDKLICYGSCNDSFFAIQQHSSFFSLWVVDEQPKDLTPSGVESFMLDNPDRGWSVAGACSQVMEELELFARECGVKMEDLPLTYVEEKKAPLSEQIRQAETKAGAKDSNTAPIPTPER